MSTACNFLPTKNTSIKSVIQECLNWILCQPCTYFRFEDLSRVNLDNNFVLSNHQELITYSDPRAQNTPTGSLTYHRISPTHNLSVQIEAKANKDQLWIKYCSIETIKKSPSQLPRLNNSSLTIRLLSQFGGGLDSELTIQIAPTTLKDIETGGKTASSIFEQKLNCKLPIIYISASEKDKHAVIPDRLTRNLCGMAHIIVEPSRVFSRKLRHEVDSRNIYGGILELIGQTGQERHFSEGAPKM